MIHAVGFTRDTMKFLILSLLVNKDGNGQIALSQNFDTYCPIKMILRY